MTRVFNATRLHILVFLTLLTATLSAFAGGGPQNVLIVVNANSKESLEIGNAYRRARNIPYLQLLTISTASSFQISYQTYQDEIESPVRVYLKNQQLADQITSIVLTRGVPQMVTIDNGRSTASLLATMNVADRGKQAYDQLANPFYNTPDAFSHRTPNLKGIYLVTVLNGYQNNDVKRLIANGVAADSTAPNGRFVLQSNTESAPAAHQIARSLAIRNLNAEVTTAPPPDRNELMGYFSGGIYSGINREFANGCKFRPGAIVDLAQQFSAAPNNFEETAPPVYLPVSAFIHASVTGIHGVVGDAGLNSIPAASALQPLLDKYTGGYSLAESFYAALPFLNWQNMVIGDPLCSPYAQRPVVTIDLDAGPHKNVVPVRVSATSPVRGTTISRIDIYIDDQYAQTVYEPNSTQVILYIGEEVVSYTVPRGATRRMVLEGLAEAVNTDVILSGPDGVKAVPSLNTSTLVLSARKEGAESNDIPIGINITSSMPASPGIMARVEGGWLSGGGQDPTTARAILSFLGRSIKPGDAVSLQIQQEHLQYTVPDNAATLSALLDALVGLINTDPALQGPDGVIASRGDHGMPYIILQARTPGEAGNAIAFHLAVTPMPGSALRGYPDVPSQLSGGHGGSAATQTIHFMMGEVTAKGTYLLNTAQLADGYHRLRVVAFDGSLAQVQGSQEIAFTVSNLDTPPMVKLPNSLPISSGELTVPVAAEPNVTQVNVFVDGQLLGSANANPFNIRIPLANLGRGTHDLWAEGVDKSGNRYLTPPLPLQVIVPPEVSRVTPNYTGLAGGTTHRIIGNGFQPNCIVRLAGVAARSVRYISPNLLIVVSESGPARQGRVEVVNPDNATSAPTISFEYYEPRVADVQLTPVREVIMPGKTSQFTAKCVDQHDFPLETELVWDTNGGAITPTGLFTAGTTPGEFVVRVSLPDNKDRWETPVVIGPAKIPEGRLIHWLVLGAFPDADLGALEKSQIPETTVQPSRGDQQEGLSWQPLYGEKNFLDFGSTFSPNANCVAYAHLYILAQDETPCSLVYGSDDGIRIWLNGELLQSLRIRRAADPNQNTTPVTLKAGWNRLLVKVDQGTGGWGFFMRLKAADGKRLPELYYSLDNPTPPAN